MSLEPPRPEIAFLGRSNVGKSSLLNALTGRRRLAHTSRRPGKTRLLNVYDVGGRYYLVDLPGYGYASASRAERGAFSRLLEEYLSRRSRLAGVVWLLDIRRDPTPADLAMAARLVDRGVPVLAAVTKADKLPHGRRIRRVQEILHAIQLPEDQCVVTSARTKQGIDTLREAVEDLIGR